MENACNSKRCQDTWKNFTLRMSLSLDKVNELWWRKWLTFTSSFFPVNILKCKFLPNVKKIEAVLKTRRKSVKLLTNVMISIFMTTQHLSALLYIEIPWVKFLLSLHLSVGFHWELFPFLSASKRVPQSGFMEIFQLFGVRDLNHGFAIHLKPLVEIEEGIER